MKEIIPQEVIEHKIFLIRGYKVMIDKDLANLYGVETKYLNRQVRRNMERFPEDFMFQLTDEEFSALRCHFGTSNSKPHIATSKKRSGGRRYLPYAFTEQGVAMLSSILRSKRAVHVNIAIMRAFVKLRQILSTRKDLAHKLRDLERKTEKHDKEITAIFEAIKQLIQPLRNERIQLCIIRM